MKRLVLSFALMLVAIDTCNVFIPCERVVVEERESPDEWEVFIKAMMWVESRGDSLAVGAGGDVGILQITPIMVAEANRLGGSFTLEDRHSPKKSREIFDIVQNHHNPRHDFSRACRIWNPGAGEWYEERIMRKFREMVQQYQ